jgi:hypothetical protein
MEKQARTPFEVLTTILIMTVTLFGAMVAYLQANASVYESQSRREAQAIAVQLMGELARTDWVVRYDLATTARYLSLSQESLVKQMVALQLESEGQTALAARYQAEGALAQAEADALKPHSRLLSDSRYTIAEGMPNAAKYMADMNAKANTLLEKQNAAADRAHEWADKSDAYVTILALQSVVLFLYGLSLTLRGRFSRYIFVSAGTLIAGVSVTWTVWVTIF